MLMIVCSLADDSASSVIAWWRRSWNLNPPKPAVCVRRLQAVLQVLIGCVGSGSAPPSACGKTCQLGLKGPPTSLFVLSPSSRIALHASRLRGISLCPASVLLFLTVMTRSLESMSCHCKERISQARIVVFKASVIASRATCHSGLLNAVFRRFIFVFAWRNRKRLYRGH